jgi:hypothetical protein
LQKSLSLVGELDEEWSVSRHYLSSGEMMAVLKLMKDFARRSVVPDYAVVLPDTIIKRDDNVILFGSGRTNEIIIHQHQQMPYKWSHTGGIDIGDGTCREDHVDEQNDNLLVKYGVVQREGSLTSIRAEHGRVIQHCIDFVTQGQKLDLVFALMKATTAVPDSFQLLFRVSLHRGSAEMDLNRIDLIGLWKPGLPRGIDVDPDLNREERIKRRSPRA